MHEHAFTLVPLSTQGSSLSHLSNGEPGASDTSHTSVDSAMPNLPHIMEGLFGSKSPTSSTQLMTDREDQTHKTSWISDKSVDTLVDCSLVKLR